MRRVDAVLLELVQRATDFAPHRARCARFQFGEHRSRGRVRDRPERARNRDLRDSRAASQVAKFRNRVGRRGGRIEACLDQLGVVRIRVG